VENTELLDTLVDDYSELEGLSQEQSIETLADMDAIDLLDLINEREDIDFLCGRVIPYGTMAFVTIDGEHKYLD